MRKVLKQDFFDRPTLTVARELLGKFLVRRVKGGPHAAGKTMALIITETEGYDGPPDLGSHSARGRTARTEVLFGPPGIWYVYIIYGLHSMLNITTKRDGAAVLIRGVEGFEKPGVLTKQLSITRDLNKKQTNRISGLWIEDRGVVVRPKDIERTPRIGINYAGDYAHKPWRFVLTSNITVKK
jgi:DNA-3-methyladenine glycosylase